MSVVEAHSVGREWAGLILVIFWAKDDPGDLLGQRVPLVLSHPGSIGPARSLRWSFGGRLRSCPPEPTSLVREAVLRSSCHRTARLERGVLPRTGRGCPVTLTGVMRWCAEATIITAGRRQRLWTPPPVVSRGPRERRCPLIRGCSCPSPRHKIREAGVPGPARGLSWPAWLSGGASFLERTSRIAGMALTRGARSGGCHVSREVGPPGSFA